MRRLTSNASTHGPDEQVGIHPQPVRANADSFVNSMSVYIMSPWPNDSPFAQIASVYLSRPCTVHIHDGGTQLAVNGVFTAFSAVKQVHLEQ